MWYPSLYYDASRPKPNIEPAILSTPSTDCLSLHSDRRVIGQVLMGVYNLIDSVGFFDFNLSDE